MVAKMILSFRSALVVLIKLLVILVSSDNSYFKTQFVPQLNGSHEAIRSFSHFPFIPPVVLQLSGDREIIFNPDIFLGPRTLLRQK